MQPYFRLEAVINDLELMENVARSLQPYGFGVPLRPIQAQKKRAKAALEREENRIEKAGRNE